MDEHQAERRTRAMGWLAEPAAWFGLATAGMLVVFIGLGIDAWRHNNGAGEESLLSFGNPGHLVAAECQRGPPDPPACIDTGPEQKS